MDLGIHSNFSSEQNKTLLKNVYLREGVGVTERVSQHRLLLIKSIFTLT